MNFTQILANKIPINSFSVYLTTLFNVIFILFSISLLNQDGLNVYINSDTLYLPSIFQDITEFGHTFNGWNLNPAPNFFPDMILYGVLAVFSNNFIVSVIAYSVVQYLLIVFLANKVLLATVNNVERFYILTIGNLLLALIPLSTYVANDFHFSFHLISNAYHNGAFVNALLALNFFVRFLKKGKYSLLTLLMLTIIVSVLSDRFFIFYFIVPVVGVSIIALFNKDKKKNAFKFIIATILATGIGITTFNLLKAFKLLVVFKRSLELTPQLIKDAWTIFSEQFSYYLSEFDTRSFALFLSIGLTFLLGSYLYSFIKKNSLKGSTTKFLLVLFVFCFIPLVLIIPVLLGVYTGWDTIRYNFQVVIIGLLFFGLPFNYANQKTIKIATLSTITLITFSFLFSGFILFSGSFYSGLYRVTSFYPEKVETIDRIAKKHHLQFGVAPYWTAKYTTMLSKENVRAYTCFPEMTPWYHATNENWYYLNPYTKDSVDFNFVVIQDSVHAHHFKNILGEPLKIVDTNDVVVYITKPFRYNRETYLPYYTND
ncbi:MAG: hypothetical protein ACPGSO_00515 [Vicingaceae bacterium]